MAADLTVEFQISFGLLHIADVSVQVLEFLGLDDVFQVEADLVEGH